MQVPEQQKNTTPTCMQEWSCAHTKSHTSQNKIINVLRQKPNNKAQLTDENGASLVLLLDGPLRLRALGEGRFEHEAPQCVVALKVRHPLLELLLLKVRRHKAHLDVAVLGVKVSRVHLSQAERGGKCNKGVCAFVILCSQPYLGSRSVGFTCRMQRKTK